MATASNYFTGPMSPPCMPISGRLRHASTEIAIAGGIAGQACLTPTKWMVLKSLGRTDMFAFCMPESRKRN